ncbi:uncharacterized protein LOC115447734 [Manduca sexta]|uniref:uncharacterized protein LOC115447734 n=1 Tax=Manduca sexta TaxID=7130 RepID=UPI00188E0937|nr:uncharacterized protein LOC115447734 [Manduca sexta]
MGLQFEGAIDNISAAQLEFISDVIKNLGYTDVKVTILVLGKAGDNFAANVKRIIIQNGNGELRMVAKFAPTHELVRSSNKTEYVFKNEHIMYTQVLPKFQQLEEQANVPKEDRLRFPKCYGSYTNAPNELILLEDLQVPGFSMLDRFKPLPDQCIKSVLKNFGKLHSLSFALRYKDLDAFNEYTNALYDPWVNVELDSLGDLKKLVTDIEDKAVMAADGEKAKRLLKGCLFDNLEETIAMKKDLLKSRHSVIVQGDAWTNNILFKFDGDSLEESVMIDYQLSKLENPTFDIMYLIFNCTDHEDRLKNFNDWIDYYHTELDKALHNHDLKAEHVYPRNQIDKDMKKLGKGMLGVCVLSAWITLLQPDDAVKVKEALETNQFEELNEMTKYNEEYMSMFKKRVNGLAESFEHFGFLKSTKKNKPFIHFTLLLDNTNNMAHKFEGAVENISEIQLGYISEVIEKQGYKDSKVTIEVVGQAGDNYVANVKRIIVHGDNAEFRMIAKIAPQLELTRNSMHIEKLFRNEHVMYTKVLPKFQQLEEQAGLPKESRLRFAECYGSLTDAPHEVILLEDLQVSGFVMLDRFKSLSDECIKSVLKNFASLHSLSYALKHKEMETFNAFNNELYDAWVNMGDNPMTLAFFNQLESTAIMVADGAERKRLLKGCISQSIEQGLKAIKQDVGSKYSVIQQGDSWTNNIMFKFNNGVLQQSIMIDYQVSKESSPVCDIMYLLFNCTDYKTLKLFFNDWIDYYHSALDRALYNYGLKSSYVYPRDKLDADIRRYGRVMFGTSVIISSVIVVKPEAALQVKEAMEKAQTMEALHQTEDLDPEYRQMFKQRLEGVIDSYLEFGLLQL